MNCSRPRHLRRLLLVDADARSTYRVAMLRCATPTTSDPSLCTVGHTADASGRTGSLPAGLWRRRAGRPSGIPDASTPVGSECGGPADLPPENPRPHNWCSHQSALVAGSRTNSVQAGCLAYRVLRGNAPHYLGPLVRVDDLPGRWPLRSTSWYRHSDYRQSAAGPLRLRLHTSWTGCQLMSLLLILCQPFVDY